MVETETELLEFFKALSDATRLRIAGRLAERDCSVEELAAWLGEKPAAVRRHLARLAVAGLVAGPSGAAQVHRLHLDGVRSLAGRLLAHEVTTVPAGAAADHFEHKVLREFLNPDGSLRDFPAQDRKFRVIVRYALGAFEPGRRYTEKEVNLRLKRYHPDVATLRRALVDFGLLQRQSAGQAYWRADAIPVP
jgi:DNA-binding transcriptional ArsR family regulator